MLNGGRFRFRRLVLEGCEDRIRRDWVGEGGAVKVRGVPSASASSVPVEVTLDKFELGMVMDLQSFGV